MRIALTASLDLLPPCSVSQPRKLLFGGFCCAGDRCGLLLTGNDSTGETIGGLLNASFGNAVELIVAILALIKDEVLIVQTSLIGSILSNLLLVLGMCFFFGGLNRIEQKFNVVVAQTAASLLALAVGSLIIPTAFKNWSTGRKSFPDVFQNMQGLIRGVPISGRQWHCGAISR
jgi:calcium/proton exchanger cax